jgi:hypothetical protein
MRRSAAWGVGGEDLGEEGPEHCKNGLRAWSAASSTRVGWAGAAAGRPASASRMPPPQ